MMEKVKFNIEEIRKNGLEVANLKDAINYLIENLEYLEGNNKNYTSTQYWRIIDCLEIVKNIEVE